jgi:hypothetical protein
MPISRVGNAAAETTSVTLPAHSAGDLILIFAFREGSATPPSLPAGYTDINSGGTAGSSCRMGFKVAVDGATTSGTWTNATSILAAIYRGSNGFPADPIGASAAYGPSDNDSFYADTITSESTASWLAIFCGDASQSATYGASGTWTNGNTMPRVAEYRTATFATQSLGLFDSNGYKSGWVNSRIFKSTYTSYKTIIVEILDRAVPMLREKFLRGASAPYALAVTAAAAGAASFRGGLAFDTLGRLLYDEGGTIADYVAGSPKGTNGAIVTDASSAIAQYRNGLPYTSEGKLCVLVDSGTFGSYVRDWPISTTGRVLLTTVVAA